jgi:hypothetical protein
VKRALAVSVILAFGLVTACAPAPPTPTPTPEPTATPAEVLATKPEHIAGIWSAWNEWYIRYSPDGTTKYSRALGLLDTLPEGQGEFWFEGEVFREESPDCEAIAAYEIRLDIREGRVVRLLFETIEDPYPACHTRTERYRRPLYRVDLEQ